MKEFSMVVLRHDLPDHALTAGDIGTIVLAHSDGEAYEVEFIRSAGRTPALLTLSVNEIGPLAGAQVSVPRAVPRS